MPSVSKAQANYMGMELAKQRSTGKNDTGMSERQLSDFASTKRSGLPGRIAPKGAAKPVSRPTSRRVR